MLLLDLQIERAMRLLGHCLSLLLLRLYCVLFLIFEIAAAAASTIQGLLDNMSPFVIGKSVLLIVCHILRWLTSIYRDERFNLCRSF